MPTLGPEPKTRAQWDALQALMVAESAPGGRLNSCAWKDVVGIDRTASIIDVRRNVEAFFGDVLTPDNALASGVAGVQLATWDPQVYAEGRYWLVSLFQISVAAMSIARPTTGGEVIANADDALMQVWSFIEDGNGKGLSAILRDSSNATLGGLCNSLSLGRGVPRVYVMPGETPQIWAYVDLSVKTETPLGR